MEKHGGGATFISLLMHYIARCLCQCLLLIKTTKRTGIPLFDSCNPNDIVTGSKLTQIEERKRKGQIFDQQKGKKEQERGEHLSEANDVLAELGVIPGLLLQPVGDGLGQRPQHERSQLHHRK